MTEIDTLREQAKALNVLRQKQRENASKYYYANKTKILQKRKSDYKSNETLRERVKDYARKAYHRKKKIVTKDHVKQAWSRD